MNKTKIGLLLSLALMLGLTSCGEQKSNTKLILNEVLIQQVIHQCRPCRLSAPHEQSTRGYSHLFHS